MFLKTTWKGQNNPSENLKTVDRSLMANPSAIRTPLIHKRFLPSRLIPAIQRAALLPARVQQQSVAMEIAIRENICASALTLTHRRACRRQN